MKKLKISAKALYDCLSSETSVLHPNDAAGLLCAIYESVGEAPPKKYVDEAKKLVDCDYE